MKSAYSNKKVFDDLIHLRKRNYKIVLEFLFMNYVYWPMKTLYFEILFLIFCRIFDRFDIYIKLAK